MSDKKTINLDPSLLFSSKKKYGGKTKKLKQKPNISDSKMSTSKLKSTFIKKIKELKKKSEYGNNNKTIKKSKSNSNNDEFNESINFVKQIIHNNNETKQIKNKISNPVINTNSFEENTFLNKPKSITDNKLSDNIINKPSIKPITNHNINSIKPPVINMSKINQPKTNNKTVKIQTIRKNKTVKVGKNKSKNIISVLLKNKADKKYVEQFKSALKIDDYGSIKQHLNNRGFIKNNSTAPSSIIRTMYENVRTIGNVTNINPQNISDLENF